MTFATSILSILLAAQPAPSAPSKPSTAPATQSGQNTLHPTLERGLYWNLLRTEQFGIGIPQNWSDMPPRPNMVLFIAKEGIKDETNQPLDIGISIERLTKPTQSLEKEAKHLVERYQAEKTIKIQGKPQTQSIKLSDGTPAVLVSLELLSNNNRRTYMQKLLAQTKDHRWVVTGYIVGGDQSILPRADSDMARKIRAHLLTFTFDANKLDQQPLNKAYLTPPPAPGAAPPASQPAPNK